VIADDDQDHDPDMMARREVFAAVAMHAMIVHGADNDMVRIIDRAVAHADALIERLGKK